MTDVVRQDDEIAADVERLTRPVQLVGELRLQELLAGPACAVKDHDRIVDLSSSIAMRLPKRRHMHPEARQRLAVAETEIFQDEVLLMRGPRLRRRQSNLGGECRKQSQHQSLIPSVSLPAHRAEAAGLEASWRGLGPASSL